MTGSVGPDVRLRAGAEWGGERAHATSQGGLWPVDVYLCKEKALRWGVAAWGGWSHGGVGRRGKAGGGAMRGAERAWPVGSRI